MWISVYHYTYCIFLNIGQMPNKYKKMYFKDKKVKKNNI